MHCAQRLSKVSEWFLKTEKQYVQRLSKVSEWEEARKVKSKKSEKSEKLASENISDYEKHYAQWLSKDSEWFVKQTIRKMYSLCLCVCG